MAFASWNKLIVPFVQEGTKDSELGKERRLATTTGVRGVVEFPAAIQDFRHFVERVTPFTDALLAQVTLELGKPHLGGRRCKRLHRERLVEWWLVLSSPAEEKRSETSDDCLVCRQASVRRREVRAAVTVFGIEEDIERCPGDAEIEDHARETQHIAAARPVTTEDLHLSRKHFNNFVEGRGP